MKNKQITDNYNSSENFNSATILLSGGLDSTILLHYIAKKICIPEIYCLSFNYGQKHSIELQKAKWQVKQISQVKKHIIIDISFFADLLNNACVLTRGGKPIPNLKDIKKSELSQPPTYTPNRNMVLLSLAAAFAEAHNCDVIYYGAQAQDEYGYWDCTTEFIKKINAVLCLNRKNKIKILAPFVNLKKADELKIGVELKVNFSQTWSCYKGGKKHCGECPTCIERKNAFKNINLPDPTDYLKK